MRLLAIAVKEALPRSCREYPPYGVANIVGDEQRTSLVDGNANRSAVRISIVANEAGQHVNRRAVRLPIRKGDENNLVAAAWITIPRTVFPDESTAVVLRGKEV